MVSKIVESAVPSVHDILILTKKETKRGMKGGGKEEEGDLVLEECKVGKRRFTMTRARFERAKDLFPFETEACEKFQKNVFVADLVVAPDVVDRSCRCRNAVSSGRVDQGQTALSDSVDERDVSTEA